MGTDIPSESRPPGINRNAWRDAVWASELPPLQRLVALCYADHAGDGRVSVWVTRERGIERTGMSRGTWRQTRQALERAGWLHEVQAATPNSAAHYRLTLPEGHHRTPAHKSEGHHVTPGGSAEDPREGHHVTPNPCTTPTEPATKKAAAEKAGPRAMDDATWLAAELDANPAACRAAIDAKRRHAERSGRPWRSPRHMVRNVIPLDEWRTLVADHQRQHATVATDDEDGRTHQVPARMRVAQNPCRYLGAPGHQPHHWTDRRGLNRFHCPGT